MKIDSGWILGLVVAGTSGVAQAALTWENREASPTPLPGAAQVEAAFAFVNEGEAPVTITSVTTSCGCTTAALDKKTYAPGERGAIRASFTPGDRTGAQIKHVTVRTDAPEQAVVTLTLKVTIPKVLETRPRFVYWRPGEPLEPKTVQIKVVQETPIDLVAGIIAGEAEDTGGGTDDPFKLALKSVEPGRRYELTITPLLPGAGATAGDRVTVELSAKPEDEGAKPKKLTTVLVRVIGGEEPTASAAETGQSEAQP